MTTLTVAGVRQPLAALPLLILEALHQATLMRIGVLEESLADDHEALDAPCVREALAEAHVLRDLIAARQGQR